MKNLLSVFHSRPLLAIVLVALALLTITGAVLAAVGFTLSVPSTATITDYVPPGGTGGGGGGGSGNTYAIAVYTDVSMSDASRLTTSTSYDWGSIAAGNSVQKLFYVKNIGTASISSVSVSLSGTVPAGLTVVGSTATLAPNDTATLTATIAAATTATPGALSGLVTDFVSNY